MIYSKTVPLTEVMGIVLSQSNENQALIQRALNNRLSGQ